MKSCLLEVDVKTVITGAKFPRLLPEFDLGCTGVLKINKMVIRFNTLHLES